MLIVICLWLANKVSLRKIKNLFTEFTKFIDDQDKTMLFVCRVHKIKNFVSGTLYRVKRQKNDVFAGI